MAEKRVNVRQSLTKMLVGEQLTFPIENTKSIRAQSSDLGLILNRIYKTETNRDNRTITVTRTA